MQNGPGMAFGLGWIDRGMQLANAIARKNPDFAEKLDEARHKFAEQERKVRGSQTRPGLVAGLEDKIERWRRQGAVLVGKDFTTKETRL